ncbi:MAG: molybdenum cofactor guanylyltransferase [Mycobacterium sp.]|nr:molybdenum cofactor guanylyltransferase [Mycobacterium sp.]
MTPLADERSREEHLAAVVLAGGASRRMGRDKATLPYLGGTLLNYVVKVVEQRCAPIFVIAAPGQSVPSVDAEILRDDVRGVGPLVATGRGLRAAADAGATWAFVCAVDMPFLDPVLIDVLVESAKTLISADVVLPWDGRDHFLAGLYRTSLVGHVSDLVDAGERSMAALVNSVEAQRIVVADGRSLTNVNSADELSVLR